MRGGNVATHGWLRRTDAPAREAFAALRERACSQFVFTNIDHDGMLDGPDREEVRGWPRAVGEGSLIYSGGIGTLADLEGLAALRAELDLEALGRDRRQGPVRGALHGRRGAGGARLAGASPVGRARWSRSS